MYMLIIITIVIYLLSAVAIYRYIHIAYSKDGIWNYLSPDILDALIVFLPLVNTCAALVYNLLGTPDGKKRKISLSKFF